MSHTGAKASQSVLQKNLQGLSPVARIHKTYVILNLYTKRSSQTSKVMPMLSTVLFIKAYFVEVWAIFSIGGISRYNQRQLQKHSVDVKPSPVHVLNMALNTDLCSY